MNVIISPTISWQYAICHKFMPLWQFPENFYIFSSFPNSISYNDSLRPWHNQFQSLNSRSCQDKHHWHHKFLISAPSVNCSAANWSSSFQTFFYTELRWNTEYLSCLKDLIMCRINASSESFCTTMHSVNISSPPSLLFLPFYDEIVSWWFETEN